MFPHAMGSADTGSYTCFFALGQFANDVGIGDVGSGHRNHVQQTLAAGVALIGEVDTAPELLATTDQTIEEVADGAVRYAGSVGKLLS